MNTSTQASPALSQAHALVPPVADLLATEIIRHSDDAIVAKRLDGVVLSWNPAAERIFGYTSDEMVGQTILRLFPEDRRFEEAELIGRLLRGDEISHFETQRRRKDGALLDISVTLSPIRDETGKIYAVSKIARDITSTKTMQRALAELGARLKTILDHAPSVIAYLREDQTVEFANASYAESLGLPVDALPGRRIEALAGAETYRRILPHLQGALRGQRQSFERSLARADGRHRHYQLEYIPHELQGHATGVFVFGNDITERKLAERALAAQNERMRVTLDSIADAVITTNAEARVEWLNPVAAAMTGWSVDAARGHPVEEVFCIVDEATRQPAPHPVQRCLQEARPVSLNDASMLRARDGREYAVDDSAAPIRDDTGAIIGAILVFHDVSEQRKAAQEIRHRATRDALTGLLNRSEFETRLRELLARPAGGPHALLYIDLDNFKIVNDSCGHAVGDQLLLQVARLLEGIVRSGDAVARLGGDEFAILLTACPREDARQIAQLLCQRMEGFCFTHKARRFRVGASVGLAAITGDAQDLDEVMAHADAACLAAKQAGRNRVEEWVPGNEPALAHRRDTGWAIQLEDALAHGHFQLLGQRLQPAMPGCSGLYVELLLHLRDGDNGLIPAAVFQGSAERFHLASRIDRWVLEQALHWMQQQPAGSLACVLIPLSAASVSDPDFGPDALARIEAAGLAPGILWFEITETTATTHLAEAATLTASLSAAGVRIALTEFGSGASSPGYLRSLTVDALKLDGRHVRGLRQDRLDRAMVSCLREITRALGLCAMAEGVEDAATAEQLQQLGIQYLQGRHLHAPEDLEGLQAAALQARVTPGDDQKA